MDKGTTKINTADGETVVEWWGKEHFEGRATRIYSGNSVDAYPEGASICELMPVQVIPIPDDCVLCDFCNAKIEEFPVPVVWRHALCKECSDDIKKEEGDG